jgi:transposase-like protein
MSKPKGAQPTPACPKCNAQFTIKKGRRLNRFRNLPIFQCRECLYKFTAVAGKSKTYPPRVILATVSTYNLGNSVSDTQRAVRSRIPQFKVPF